MVCIESVIFKYRRNCYDDIWKSLHQCTTKFHFGITVDYKWKWEKHVEYVINKTKYLTFIFKQLSQIMKIETKVTIVGIFS